MRVSPVLAAPWFLSTLHCFWSHLPGCLVPLCVRVHVHVPVSLCRPLCVPCLSLCCVVFVTVPTLLSGGSVFQKKIVGMALTKRTVQSLPVSA